MEEVPPNSTVVGVPGRVVKRDNIHLPQDELDQVHMPDPVREDLNNLWQMNRMLSERLEHMEDQLRENTK